MPPKSLNRRPKLNILLRKKRRILKEFKWKAILIKFNKAAKLITSKTALKFQKPKRLKLSIRSPRQIIRSRRLSRIETWTNMRNPSQSRKLRRLLLMAMYQISRARNPS